MKKRVGAVTVLLAVFGGVVLLATGARATVEAVYQITARDLTEVEVGVHGVTSLDLDVRGADVTVEFRADAEQAQLRIEDGSPSGWVMEHEGDTLEVHGPNRGFDFFRPDWLRGDERVTLVLPEWLHGVDADLTLAAGSLTVDGLFGELALEVSAGSLSVQGAASGLDVEVNAGRADINLRDVRTAEYTLTAGRLRSVLRAVPDDVSINVSAGGLDLTLPDVDYDLRQQLTAGSLNSELAQNSASRQQIHANVSAGSVTLRTAG